MPKHNHVDLVELPTSSPEKVKASKKFFGEVFGWKFTDYGDAYIDTHDSGTAVGVTSTPTRGTMPLAVIYVDDLEAAYKKVKAAGAEILVEVFEFPGGRRFHFREPGGNELAAWSE